MSSTGAVPAAVRLRLGHACLQHLAELSRARVLHVKGEALHPSLTRDRPPSTDCDVLVHPADVPAFTTGLTAHGWERRTGFEHGSVFEHAATYYHPAWGTVDVHRRFPGLDRDPARSFERLWDDHEVAVLGGVPCPVPGLRGQRLLMLVHAARDAMGRRERDTAAAWGEADDAERAALDALAEELGARVPMALVTGRPERAAGQPGEHVWRAVHRDADATEVWRARLLDAHGGAARLRVLVSALHVNPDHLALRLGHAPSARERRREWWARWGRGLTRSTRMLRRRWQGRGGRGRTP